MKIARTIRRKRRESGVALLLAIFVLLIVAVAGIAMMAASGTETSLAGNYRSATGAYYAAMSGLEEGRGRLLPKNKDYLGTPGPGLIPAIGTLLPLGHVIYIRNPIGGETVDPTNLGNPNTYPDTEYQKDFPGFYPPSSVVYAASVQNIAGSPNALYKWVRINALTEFSIRSDVNNSNPGDPTQENTAQTIRFDGTNLSRQAAPYQALGVTALAALPDGSRKLLQYVVAPITLQVPVSAALTIAGPGSVGNVATFTQPSPPHYTFAIHGDDQALGENGGLTCSVKPSLPAVGVMTPEDYTSVHDNTLVAPQPGNYTGGGVTAPSVSPGPSYVHPNNSTVDMTDPISLSNFLPLVQNAADSVLSGPRTETDMPSAMSPTNPMTVYVNGDLSLTGFTGYGLLVVRGNLTYTGDSGWKGIVIVLGGTIQETNSASTGEFDGAVYLANLTVSGGGGVSLGAPTYNVANNGGKGIYYDSCWVNAAEKPYTYKVLSFREIPYP